jgi:hypothetical protein
MFRSEGQVLEKVSKRSQKVVKTRTLPFSKAYKTAGAAGKLVQGQKPALEERHVGT